MHLQIILPAESPWASGRVQVAVSDQEEDVPIIYLDSADVVIDTAFSKEKEKT